MKLTLRRFMLAAFALTALVVLALADEPEAVLGKINFAGLFDAAPVLPTSTTDAAKRVLGADIEADLVSRDFSAFYAPYEKKIAAAHEVLQPAVNSRPANQEARTRQAVAGANSSAIIARMGGAEKMSQMSEEEQQQAAAQAMGSYQQSMSGAPPGASSGGMQAMMQRMMNDPEYQARFEKMSKKEQEAEMQKYMGNANAPAPPKGETAAERRAEQGQHDASAAVARQNEVSAIYQRIREIEAEFAKKDAAISTAAGNHDQIGRELNAKIEKVPMVETGVGATHDPAKVKQLMRERAALDRARAAAELQQRTALYSERRTKYKELAASYASWLKQGAGPNSNITTSLMNNSAADTALHCEEELIGLAENLRKYHEQTTRDAAMYEQQYQKNLKEM
jgi:hypothetical protein